MRDAGLEEVTDQGLTLRQVCARLGISRDLWYDRERHDFWRKNGIIELPRPTLGSKRHFSAASLDRFIRYGTRVTHRR